MIDLERSLTELRPQHSLLLAYAASLTHFEYELLDGLQRNGVGRVTILTDARSYAQSFAESTAIRGPGIDYRFAPLHLPNPRAAFHPKLYLLFHDAGATLFVASANLTLHGCRRNAEIVDRLDLGHDGTGDARAFAQCSGFLAQLSAIDPGLSPAVRDELLGSAADLDALQFSAAAAAETGPELLHTLERPLLEQVVARVPGTEVTEIVAVSPFFDQQSEAVLALARAFPAARILLHRRPDDPSEINGALLKELRGRLRVFDFRLDGEGNGDRPLHAKWMLLRGTGRAWLLAGSANLSAPAWLRRSGTGKDEADTGNVEVITFRELADSTPADALVATLVGEEMADWTQRTPLRQESSTASYAGAGFRVTEARLSEGRIFVTVTSGDETWLRAEYEARIPLPLQRFPLHDALGVGGADTRLLWCMAPETMAQEEIPVVLEVEARAAEGEVSSVRVWLDWPQALERSADERAFRRSLSNIGHRGMWAEGGDLVRVADLLARLATEVSELHLARRAHAPPPPAAVSRGANGEHLPSEPTQRWIAGVTASEGRLGPGARETSEPGALLDRIIASLGLVWDSTHGGNENRPIRIDLPRQPDEIVEEVEQAPPPLAPRDHATLVRRLEAVADAIRPGSGVVSDVKDRARIAVALAHLGLHVYLRTEEAGVADRRALLCFLRDWFEQVLSLESFSLGAARGWLVRAWMNRETREEVQQIWAGRSTAIQMAALMGTTLALWKADPETRGDASTALAAGFQLISGWTAGQRDSSWVADLRDYAIMLASHPGAPETQAILDAILQPVVDRLPVFRLARECAPLLAAQNGTSPYSVDHPVEPPASLLRQFARLSERRKHAIVSMISYSDGRGGCSRCHILLPLASVSRALNHGETVSCPQCGLLLLPFDYTNEGVRLVLQAVLAPSTEA
jgi:hypothetical protein